MYKRAPTSHQSRPAPRSLLHCRLRHPAGWHEQPWLMQRSRRRRRWSPSDRLRHQKRPAMRSSSSPRAGLSHEASARARKPAWSAKDRGRVPSSMLRGQTMILRACTCRWSCSQASWETSTTEAHNTCCTSSVSLPVNKTASVSSAMMGVMRGHALVLCGERVLEQACRCTKLAPSFCA